MLGTREYTLCSPFRANAHNSSLTCYWCQLALSDDSQILLMFLVTMVTEGYWLSPTRLIMLNYFGILQGSNTT